VKTLVAFRLQRVSTESPNRKLFTFMETEVLLEGGKIRGGYDGRVFLRIPVERPARSSEAIERKGWAETQERVDVIANVLGKVKERLAAFNLAVLQAVSALVAGPEGREIVPCLSHKPSLVFPFIRVSEGIFEKGWIVRESIAILGVLDHHS